ncbi:uncharacterized protein METZ01_LOCUS32455 [marine metagenome]|uniref:Uncharacterized protein n=1 Tax=marine metagenome TaxID=408172 RepID=A0A381QJT2_9ZZZZ
MALRALFLAATLFSSSSLAAAPDLSGIWTLNGPGTESEILLTEEGLRIQSEYDLLVDDPSLFCVPASASRIWANPGARILIQQSEEAVLISYELFDLRRDIPIGDESVMSNMPSTKNITGTYFQEMGSSFARYVDERLIIESRNHSLGYIRTSRGIPQSRNTIANEVLRIEGDTLHLTHTYFDDTLYENPIVMDYFFRRTDESEITLYECREANYDWFNELNAPKEEETQ